MKKALLAILLFAAPAYGQQAAIRYVSEKGADSNDGLSWERSKATVFGALVSLPGGNVVGPFSGSGTVYVAPGSALNRTANAGIWFMAPHDPNYANPPTGWLRCNGCTLNIIGAGNYPSGPNSHKNKVLAGGGIRLSGTQLPIYIANFGFEYPERAVVIGECSNGDRSGRCGVAGVVLENVTANIQQNPTSGPCTDITGNSFWIWLRDYGCSGNAYNAAGGRFANNAAAILIDGTGNSGNGLIHINDSNFAGGGIKFIPGANGGSLYVSNVTEEGDFAHAIPPVVWFSAFGGGVDSYLSNIQMADGGPGSTPAIRNDGGGPGPTVANTTGGRGIQGPAVVLNQDNTTFTSLSASPVLSRQTGFFNGYIVGETDSARRIAGLVPVVYQNLAKSDATTWTATQYAGTTTLTTAPDPFRGPYARKAESSGGTPNSLFLTGICTAVKYTPVSGDWIVAGAWVKGANRTSLDALALPTCGYPSPKFSNKVYQQGMMTGDGQWTWQWLAYKVSGGVSTYFGLSAQFSASSSITAYGPVLYIIPSGTISDDDALEFASTMASVDSACPVGSICNMPGHRLVTIQ